MQSTYPVYIYILEVFQIETCSSESLYRCLKNLLAKDLYYKDKYYSKQKRLTGKLK